jgi:CheY-like chemotaxis protein
VASQQARIMIVEDEFLIAQELQDRLESLGYKVTMVVESGEEALAVAKEDPPQVVIMDIRLQGAMNGIETASVLRNELGIPSIYVTAYAEDGMLDGAAKTDHSGYLIKPYRDKELQAAVEAALFKSSLEQERRELVESLRNSLAEGKRLAGILAICSECKKIRNEKGAWQDIERYVREHSQATFSHSLCPDCVKKLYPDLWEKLRDEGHLD